MKFLIALLIVPSVVFAAPQKKFVLDQLTSLVDVTTLKSDLQALVDVLGSDPTEQACEQYGHKFLTGLLDHAVPLICHSLQELLHHFHIVPATTVGKRFVLDQLTSLVDVTTLKADLQALVDVLGSDPTEQACEQYGHKFLSGLLDHAVPLICHSLQELLHHFHIVPATTVGKRFVLDQLTSLVDVTTLKADLQALVDVLGSDPTEQACEQYGHKFLSGLLDHAVPLICHSLQELLHHFHIVPATTVGKRFVLDQLTSLVDVTTLKADLQALVDVLGSDPTEQACEQYGHKFLSGLLDHAVPLICHSLQELLHHFHIVPATTVGKRFVLDQLTSLVDVTTLKADLQALVDVLGSDPTEQACEQYGHKFLSGLLDHAVPLICHSLQELLHHFHIVPATTVGKRFVLDQLTSLVDVTTLKADLQALVDVLGSDPTEQACEQYGHKFLSGLLDHAVPLICHSLQELLHHFHIVPATTVGKRFVLDQLTSLVDVTTLKADLQALVDVLGSDPTEQACEQYGHKFLTGLLDHAVPLICHSLQELLHHFHIVPATTVGKRFVVDQLTALMNVETLKQHLQQMVDFLGSDPAEQACEQYGHKVLSGIADSAVPLICHSFQELIRHFNIHPATAGKRLLLDTFDSTTLKAELQTLLDVLGSDPTELACEHKGMQLITDPLLVHAVPLICHSFQSLISHFHLTAPTTTAATV